MILNNIIFNNRLFRIFDKKKQTYWEILCRIDYDTEEITVINRGDEDETTVFFGDVLIHGDISATLINKQIKTGSLK